MPKTFKVKIGLREGGLYIAADQSTKKELKLLLSVKITGIRSGLMTYTLRTV